jgi:uncharacterized protein (DUF4415 family)
MASSIPVDPRTEIVDCTYKTVNMQDRNIERDEYAKMRKPRLMENRELKALAKLPDDAIDTSDIREIRDWSAAKMGQFYRPAKRVVTIRLDADVIEWFKSKRGKYQTAVNRVLRDYMLKHL